MLLFQALGRQLLLILLDARETDLDHAQALRIGQYLCDCVILGEFVRMKVDLRLRSKFLLALVVEIRVERVPIDGLIVPGDGSVEFDGKLNDRRWIGRWRRWVDRHIEFDRVGLDGKRDDKK